MANKVNEHLGEERIIHAVIDGADMEEEVRRHLLACPECRAEKEVLEDRLARFGHLLQAETPRPRRRPRLAGGEADTVKRVWRIRPAIGMGLVFASLLAVFLNPLVFRHGKDANLEKIYQEMRQDAKFMGEIESLEENPLPRFYVDISDSPDQDSPDELLDDVPGGQDDKFS